MSVKVAAGIGFLIVWGLSAPAFAQATLGRPTSQDLVQKCAQRGLPPAEREKACESALQASGLTEDLRARIHYYRGLTRLDLRQRPAALQDFDEAVRRDGGLWPAYWVRADVRGSMRDHAGSAQDWATVVQHMPDLTTPLLRRAIMQDYGGNAAEAISGISAAIALAKNDDEKAELYYHRGVIHEHSHNWPNAIADFSQSVQLNDNYRQSYYGRGRATLLGGNAAGALADLDKAAAMRPEDGYAVLWQYIARSRAGGREAATLRERRAALDLAKWPGPIIKVLLGELTPAAAIAGGMQTGWSADDDTAAARCEIEFFLAQQHLIRGERDKAAARFETVIATGIVEFLEYRAAQYELKRIRP